MRREPDPDPVSGFGRKAVRAAAALAFALAAATAWAGRYFGDAYLVAGSGVSGRADGSVGKSRLNGPDGLAYDAVAGALYLADGGNGRLCRVDLGSLELTSVSVARGLSRPARLFLQPTAGRLIVEDAGAGRVMALDLSTGASVDLFPLSPAARVLAWGGGPGPDELLLVEQASAGLYSLKPGEAPLRLGGVSPEDMGRLSGGSVFSFRGGYHWHTAGRADCPYLAVLGLEAPASVSGTSRNLPPLTLDQPAWSVGLLSMRGAELLSYWSPGENAAVLYNPSDGTRALMRPGQPQEPVAGKGTRSFFARPPSLAYDDVTGTLYASDGPSHRVLAFRARAWRSDAMAGEGIRTPPTSLIGLPGLRRVLVFGDSFSFVSDEGVRQEDLLVPRLQHYWNLFDSLSGRPGNRELILSAEHLGWGSDPVTRAYEHWALVEKLGAKELLLLFHQNNLQWLAAAYLARPMPADLVAPADGERLTQAVAESLASDGPMSQAIHARMLQRQDLFELQPGGSLKPRQWANGLRLFEDARYRKLALGIFSKNLARLQARCVAQGIKLRLVLLPLRNELGQGEVVAGGRNYDVSGLGESLGQPMERAVRAMGLDVTVLYRDVQKIEPVLFPLVRPGDDHYLPRGHETLALLAGFRLSQRAAAEEAGPPGPPMLGRPSRIRPKGASAPDTRKATP